MKKAQTIIGDFVIDDYHRLKKSYDKAVAEKQETFMWGDQELVVNFAKYVLEYLRMTFHIPEPKTDKP